MFVTYNDLNQQDGFCAVHGKFRWLCDHERLIRSLWPLAWFVLIVRNLEVELHVAGRDPTKMSLKT